MSGAGEKLSMTEIQRRASSYDVDLSDAHAKQSLQPWSRQALVAAFAALVHERADTRPDLAEFFTAGLSAHNGHPYAAASTQMVYSASIALSVAARLVRKRGRRVVGVVTPTVDSVPAQFSGIGLRAVGILERTLMPHCDIDRLNALNLDALVVVMPNNPTGGRLSRAELTRIVVWAARHDVVLILDMSFRLLDPITHWDVVAVADDAGADVLVVDDTGKTLSLGGTKIAVVSASRRLCADVSRLSGDILLAVSELDFLLLGTLLNDAGPEGEVEAARRLIRANLTYLSRRLGTVGVGVPFTEAPDYQPSVAWISLGPARDRIVEACRSRSVAVTVGDHFYWSADGSEMGAGQIRLALLRDAEYFARGVDLLIEAIAGTTSRQGLRRT